MRDTSLMNQDEQTPQVSVETVEHTTSMNIVFQGGNSHPIIIVEKQLNVINTFKMIQVLNDVIKSLFINQMNIKANFEFIKLKKTRQKATSL